MNNDTNIDDFFPIITRMAAFCESLNYNIYKRNTIIKILKEIKILIEEVIG